MCPNCIINLTMTLGGAGSAVLLAAAGFRLSIARATATSQSATEEIES